MTDPRKRPSAGRRRPHSAATGLVRTGAVLAGLSLAGLSLAVTAPAAAAQPVAAAQPGVPAQLTAPGPGTALAPSPATRPAPRALPQDASTVRVAMTENNTLNVIVYSPGGVSAPGVADSPAVMFQQAGDQRTWTEWTAATCAGPTWHPVSSGLSSPTASPVTTSQPLQLCISGGNTVVDGTLTAVYNSTGQARTVNTLPLEQYVADTVPGESPSSWATLGGPGPQGRNWGFQELEAQAVAVRSYVLANPGGYGGYADTCDLYCQTYRGTEYVTPTSVAAASDTAGQVMVMPDGAIATTEYSASTGGYTTGGPFTIVPDAGDSVCRVTRGTVHVCNPKHYWTRTVPVSDLQAVCPACGGAPQVTGYRRNGFGTWGGRVTTVTVSGNGNAVTVSGPQMAADLLLTSDWFTVTSITTGTVHVAGHGWGHGIGMGQWGALGYAIGTDGGQGPWTYQQIVGHYYSPASLRSLPGAAASVGASGGVGGYRLAASDGGIFSFGNATFLGSMGGKPLNQPIVGMAGTPTGGGYWEVASDGGIFSFGNARFHGSTGSIRLDAPVVGMAATGDGAGYWLVASDGGVFTFGDAGFAGSAAGTGPGPGTVALVPTRTGAGYNVVNSRGTVSAFGDAPQLGDLTTAVPGYAGTVVAAADTAA